MECQGDLLDDYMHMSESTCHEAMHWFCEDVIVVFGKYYLREPNTKDTAGLLSINKSRGFPRTPPTCAPSYWLPSWVPVKLGSENSSPLHGTNKAKF
jgi:hypothetical protein